ncbi:hypothetical protein Ahy_B09g098304 [Arachis hypogaea]|uniref:Uncharacterized protein n=1 Tax=Arachis hypogaea TaxID=3818 RepID=A0A444XQY7_ARAHY|nr:hypothetical protein Ahy_B09g098304 [Arachis hypogaea]
METRASRDRMNRINRKLKFDNMFCVEPRGLSGGLCLLWKSNVNVNVYEWCDNYIKANININNDLKWQGIFVYGNPVFKKRRKLWQELTVSNISKEEPQVYLGDFNDILNQEEKAGMLPQPKICLETFRRFVDENGLMDVDLKGSKYTWFSNPRNNFITRERLDRVLVNWNWLQIYQNVSLKAAPAISSDHCALILDLQPRGRIKREFKFEAFWAEHEECKEVIKKGWQQDEGNRNCWGKFIRKRNRCIRELMKWSKRKFKRADKELERKKAELHHIQESDIIREIFPGNIAESITRTPISLINKKDNLIWPYTAEGHYTVKSGYRAAKEEKDAKEEEKLNEASSSQNHREIWGTIWRLPVPQKIRMFLWKAVEGILPVNSNLYKRRCAVKPSCSICQDENETVEHALLLCPWTRAVWFGSSIQITPTAYNVASFGRWIWDTVQKIRRETGKDQERILCKLGCVCWYIWKTRNQYIFQQATINPKQAIINAEQLAAEYHNTTSGSSTQHNSSKGRIGDKKRVTWRPPPQDRLKVNTDAAFQKDTGKAASGVVIRNWQGKFITGTTTKFTTTSATAAEAQAYREALILIKNLQIENCIIETDCLQLVQVVKARTPIVEADAILRDILQLLEEAPTVGATWTPREGNIVAHQLAAMALGNVLTSQWTYNMPNPVRNSIRTEATFAISHHNQLPQIQQVGHSFPTNQQRIHKERDIPLRGGMDTRDMHQAERAEKHQPNAAQGRTMERSNHIGRDEGADRRRSADGYDPWRKGSRQRIVEAETTQPEDPSRLLQKRRQYRTDEENIHECSRQQETRPGSKATKKRVVLGSTSHLPPFTPLSLSSRHQRTSPPSPPSEEATRRTAAAPSSPIRRTVPVLPTTDAATAPSSSLHHAPYSQRYYCTFFSHASCRSCSSCKQRCYCSPSSPLCDVAPSSRQRPCFTTVPTLHLCPDFYAVASCLRHFHHVPLCSVHPNDITQINIHILVKRTIHIHNKMNI